MRNRLWPICTSIVPGWADLAARSPSRGELFAATSVVAERVRDHRRGVRHGVGRCRGVGSKPTSRRGELGDHPVGKQELTVSGSPAGSGQPPAMAATVQNGAAPLVTGGGGAARAG